MTLSTPTRPTATEARCEIRQRLGLASKASKRSQLGYDFVTDAGDMMSHNIRRAIYGVQYAISTGRLVATAEMTVRKMTAWEFSGLVAELVGRGVEQNEVARWLNQKYGEAV